MLWTSILAFLLKDFFFPEKYPTHICQFADYFISFCKCILLEFNQVLQSDACRLQQLQCHTSTPNHPLNKFFWGMLYYDTHSLLVNMIFKCFV